MRTTMLKQNVNLSCLACILCLAIVDPLQSDQNEPTSGGFVLFAPKPNVELAFGQKLEPSNAQYAVIHASGKDFDYLHYTYEIVGTSGALLIAYYTFSSNEGAKRELRRLTQDRHFVTDNLLGNAARFFGGSKKEPGGASFAVCCKSDLIVINANKLQPDEAACARLKRVAQVVLDPKLRGNIRE